MNEHTEIGSTWLLRKLPPLGVFMAALLLSTGVVELLRVALEGTYYDRSLSSVPGDAFLCLYLALIASHLRRGRPTSRLLHSVPWHLVVGFAAAVTGILLYVLALVQSSGKETVANSYHNLVVVTIFGYAIVSTVPVIFNTGDRLLRRAAMTCLLIWLGLLAIDSSEGNLEKNRVASHRGSIRQLSDTRTADSIFLKRRGEPDQELNVQVITPVSPSVPQDTCFETGATKCSSLQSAQGNAYTTDEVSGSIY